MGPIIISPPLPWLVRLIGQDQPISPLLQKLILHKVSLWDIYRCHDSTLLCVEENVEGFLEAIAVGVKSFNYQGAREAHTAELDRVSRQR